MNHITMNLSACDKELKSGFPPAGTREASIIVDLFPEWLDKIMPDTIRESAEKRRNDAHRIVRVPA